MTPQSQLFAAGYPDALALMDALDIEATKPEPEFQIEIDQDWENETTIYTFGDGSSIAISSCDTDVRDEHGNSITS